MSTEKIIKQLINEMENGDMDDDDLNDQEDSFSYIVNPFNQMEYESVNSEQGAPDGYDADLYDDYEDNN